MIQWIAKLLLSAIFSRLAPKPLVWFWTLDILGKERLFHSAASTNNHQFSCERGADGRSHSRWCSALSLLLTWIIWSTKEDVASISRSLSQTSTSKVHNFSRDSPGNGDMRILSGNTLSSRGSRLPSADAHQTYVLGARRLCIFCVVRKAIRLE